jgi:heme-degrading monooxygenase HmoA
MARIASFHLVREPTWRTPLALARLGTDRPRLRRTDGLRFWRLLGTGNGADTGAGADLARTALFAVWDDEAALEAFMERSAVARRWERADESWHVKLRLLGGHGRWRGIDPLDGLEAGSDDGRVAIITRADVRRRSWRAFGEAGRSVDTELHEAQGLIDVVGVGEAPVGRLATFSLWESLDAATTFAYSMPRHIEVMRRTRDEDWYAEELFARFEPYDSSGSWNGRNPLSSPS